MNATKKTTRELVIMLLERSESHLRELQAQSEHLEKINGTVAENAKGVAYAKTSTRNLWVVVSGIFTLIVGIAISLIQVASG